MARSSLRRVPWCRSRPSTPSRWRAHRSPRCWSCRLSASTVLQLLQPAADCCALETVLAMAQAIRVHDGTCYRCAAALGLPSGPLLQVCRAPRRLPPAMHRSHFSDRASCTRMSGSCSASSVTTRQTVGDHRHGCRRSGRASSARRAHAGCRGTAAAMRHGWPHAHGVDLRPDSCGDHPPMSHACGTRLGGGGVTQHVRCVGVSVPVLSVRPVWVVF